jgi:ElaB/YqjD/DUF883 family membrane-anchored ribosome-binding protein
MNTVNTDKHPEPPQSQFPEDGDEFARRADVAAAATAAGHELAGVIRNAGDNVTCATRDAAKRAADTAKEVYHSAALKAEDTLATSKEYVRQNPVPVVLGAIAFGAALGYLIVMARRKPSFGERYADEPFAAVREAVLGAIAPVTHRVHQGYDSAREGANKAVDRIHHFGASCSGDSLSHRMGRIGNNLKFWQS